MLGEEAPAMMAMITASAMMAMITASAMMMMITASRSQRNDAPQEAVLQE